MASLTSAGLNIRQANLIITTAVHFVFDHVIEEQSSPSADEIKAINLENLQKTFPLMVASIQELTSDIKRGYDEFKDQLRLIIQ